MSDRANELHALRAELLAWSTGARSHLNEFLALEADPAFRVETLRAVAQADAAEAQRCSAAVVALAALYSIPPQPAPRSDAGDPTKKGT